MLVKLTPDSKAINGDQVQIKVGREVGFKYESPASIFRLQVNISANVTTWA